MKTIKITIEIEVPDNCEAVSVDESGEVTGFLRNAEPEPRGCEWLSKVGGYRTARVKNWKKTLTKVE